MTNVKTYLTALEAQVNGDTEICLAIMEAVDPMQAADAEELLQSVLSHPQRREMIDLLVNSAIFGMTDQRCASAQDLLTVALGETPKEN